MHPRLWPALALIAALAACVPAKPPAPPPDHLVLTPASFGDLKGWTSDGVAEALTAFKKSCARRLRFADDAAVGPAGMAGKVADWRSPCAAAAGLDEHDDAAARGFFEAWFRPYRCANNEATEGLFTGYYEPELRGSRTRGAGFDTPLMKRPPDLVAVDLGDFRADWRGERIAGRVIDGRLKPYETRAQIEAGALDRLNLGFVWIDDPVAAFFLQVQGSGRVDLPDGSQLRVGFDGQNGWPYVAIGRVMIERGLIDRESATMPGIRAWLAVHPAETKAILDANPSYVFFRELAGEGPIGSEGVALTPGRSLAVDTKFLPLGAPFWLEAAGDDGSIERLLIAQDTGGAIRGPVRGDLFWGHGPDAERRAGTMRARGGYFLLLPKTVTVPTS